MRGKPRNSPRASDNCRIIPAHAGQTRIVGRVCHGSPDHPRACGANPSFFVPSPICLGSSPRMRGKPHGFVTRVLTDRIIPAHAGQTRLLFLCALMATDHPRACGANKSSPTPGADIDGSSPRMRGKLRGVQGNRGHRRIIPAHAGQTHDELRRGAWQHRGLRIIPAHAGQTRRARWCPAGTSDHPRACGANTVSATSNIPDRGSSPRMRGKLDLPTIGDAQRRIIPAHAGQTERVAAGGCVHADHPRACGANALPRDPRQGPLRIIPAHAGQTADGTEFPENWSDHPRACGANMSRLAARALRPGSSPRMRGKLAGGLRDLRVVRIIPAHAGQT